MLINQISKLEVAYVRDYRSEFADQGYLYQAVCVAVFGTQVHGKGKEVEEDPCHRYERLHLIGVTHEHIPHRSRGMGGAYCRSYYLEVRMKTRNQKAREIQNLTGVIMATAGFISVMVIGSLTWYNAPSLLLGVYLLTTRRLIAGWDD